MPDGRTTKIWVPKPPEMIAKAKAVLGKGYAFEAEMLGDYATISMTCEKGDHVVSSQVVKNGPAVLTAVDRLIEEAFDALCK